uniref:Uncharacterized protein n=1 Tax=viral metagenome TaxID=1070528 RepID=A0A6C0L8L5_9ZZZZ
MWYIQKLEDDTLYSVYEFAGNQLFQKNINLIYYNIQDICDEDYKVLNNRLEEHILTWINNNMASHTVELYVYNYGIDNAIILLNKFNNSSTTKKFTNTTSKNLLFALFYNKFTIDYITPTFYRTSFTSKYNYPLSQIIIIQRVWRKRLAYKKKIKRETIENDFTYLIEKINKEITGEPSKRVLIYLVNKYRRRLSKTL